MPGPCCGSGGNDEVQPGKGVGMTDWSTYSPFLRAGFEVLQSCSHIGNLCNADVLTAMLQNAKDPRVTAVLPATVAALNVLAVVFPHW
ncbi:hypothetical protein J6590_065768 [Homalodisca vitripennis]|nr:hypothetical protein J6590_065768 [Homalodisca vitripennis]